MATPRHSRDSSGFFTLDNPDEGTPIKEMLSLGKYLYVITEKFHSGRGALLPYVTSKGAMVGAARALAREPGQCGITVNCVSRGAFPTAAEALHPRWGTTRWFGWYMN